MIPATYVVLLAAVATLVMWDDMRRKLGSMKRQVADLQTRIRVLEEERAERTIRAHDAH